MISMLKSYVIESTVENGANDRQFHVPPPVGPEPNPLEPKGVLTCWVELPNTPVRVANRDQSEHPVKQMSRGRGRAASKVHRQATVTTQALCAMCDM